jgi:hypothetical protein
MKIEIEKISKALEPIHSVRQTKEGVWVGTSCLMPHGEGISILISEGRDGYRVSDNSQALTTLFSLGYELHPSHFRRAKTLAERNSIEFDDGVFFTDGVLISQIAAAVLWIANTCQAWANEILSSEIKRQERQLKRFVYEVVKQFVPEKDIYSGFELHGESTKKHIVDYMVRIDDKRLILQTVANNPISIANNFVKFHDIKRLDDKYLCEYVTEGKWKSEDLNLMSEVSDGVIFADKGEKALADKIKRTLN